MLNNPTPGKGMSRRAALSGLICAGCLLLVPQAAPAAAQQGNRRRLYARVLNEALHTRSIDAAIGKFGAGLTAQEQQVLRSLTPSELDVLASFRGKLLRLGVLVPQDG
jgi:hypothetical protein